MESDEEKLEDYFLDYKDRGYEINTKLGDYHPLDLSYSANYYRPGDRRGVWLSISMDDEVDNNILDDIDHRVERLQLNDFDLISYNIRIEKGKHRGSSRIKDHPGKLISTQKTHISISVVQKSIPE